MTGFRKYDDHEQLVERMADKLGVDMDEELQSGRVSPDELEGVVHRCMSCEDPDNCKAWLDSRDGQGADAPPPYCRNADTLETLRDS